MNDLIVFAQDRMTETPDTTGVYLGVAGLVGITVVIIALLALFIGALVSIVRSENYHSGGKAVWALVCFVFPLLGPIVWFAVGRNSTM